MKILIMTSKRKKAYDEMRVPVPMGKREEAKELIQKITIDFCSFMLTFYKVSSKQMSA